MYSKFYTTFFAILSTVAAVFAQQDEIKIQFHGDTMLVNLKPYCIVTTNGGSYQHFSISALNGEEMILAEPKIENDKLAYYELMFLPTAKNSTWRPADKNVKDIKTAFMRQIYLSGILTPTGLDEGGVKYYTDNASEFENRFRAIQARPKDPRRVKRDRDATVQVTIGKIKQGAELVAVYEDTDIITKAGTHLKGYRFALPDGTLIAEAMLTDEHAKKCVITTKYDRHEHSVTVENLKFAVWTVTDYLIEHDYL
jgi:hypothetical protein